MKILNIAAGKMKPLDCQFDNELTRRFPKHIVNVDTSYYNYMNPSNLENEVEKGLKLGDIKEWFLNTDIFTFMENTRIIFDRVIIYRFLEHVSFTQVNYFLYLASTVLKKDGIIDIIVPNYEILAEMILKEKINKDFEAHNILLTTELLNEPSCPHASIWTPKRAYYFVELEGRFKIEALHQKFEFDGRDIYLRFLARRL